MNNIDRIELLEQRFERDTLTDMEQDELFALLNEEGKLDSWLEEGIKLVVDENIFYEDKDFLKSLSQPIEALKPDISVVYNDKKSLYRRDISLFSRRSIKIAVAAAMILFIPLGIGLLSGDHKKDIENRVIIAVEQLNYTPIIKDKLQPLVADHTSINVSAEVYLAHVTTQTIIGRTAKYIESTLNTPPTAEIIIPTQIARDDKIGDGIKAINRIDIAVKDKDYIKKQGEVDFVKQDKINFGKQDKIDFGKQDKIDFGKQDKIDIGEQSKIDAEGSNKINFESQLEINIHTTEPQELVLYASAELWQETTEKLHQSEFVVAHEEWQPSETRGQRMLRTVKEHMHHVM